MTTEARAAARRCEHSLRDYLMCVDCADRYAEARVAEAVGAERAKWEGRAWSTSTNWVRQRAGERPAEER